MARVMAESEVAAHLARVLVTEEDDDREAALADILLENAEARKLDPNSAAQVALAVAALVLSEEVQGKDGTEVKLAISLESLLGTGTTGQAGTAQAAEELLYKAMYAQAAFKRVIRARDRRKAFEREVRFHQSHLQNSRRRISAARLVDAAAKEYGALLGWRAVMDASTTGECENAHGKNFSARHRPAIGWPGAVHGWCRCAPGPPVPGAPVLR